MIEAMPERDQRRPDIGRGAMKRFPDRTTPPRWPTSDGAYDMVRQSWVIQANRDPHADGLSEGVG